MIERYLPFLVVISVLIDVAAGLAYLLHGRLSEDDAIRLGFGRIVRAVGVVSAVFVVKLAGLSQVRLDAFGAIHLAYVDMVVGVPAIGAVLLVIDLLRSGRGRPLLTTAARTTAVASLTMLGVGWYATFVEPFRLQIERASAAVKPARAGRNAIRIAVLSDLQVRKVTDYERSAIDRLMAERPDLILLPGDVFQGDDDVFDAERPALRDLLTKLDAPCGVFMVPGDVDQGYDRVKRLVEGTRIVPLVNQTVRFACGDRTITIAGIELNYRSAEVESLIDRMEKVAGDDDVRILLAHRPDAVFQLTPDSRIDLVVSGHTHGGQIVVPGFGPIITLSQVPRAVAAGGLHKMHGNAIYVSRGVGCERAQAPRIRFFCPPEVSIVTIEGMVR